MRSSFLLAILAALAACAGARPPPGAAGDTLTVVYGGDGRGAIGPCG